MFAKAYKTQADEAKKKKDEAEKELADYKVEVTRMRCELLKVTDKNYLRIRRDGFYLLNFCAISFFFLSLSLAIILTTKQP